MGFKVAGCYTQMPIPPGAATVKDRDVVPELIACEVLSCCRMAGSGTRYLHVPAGGLHLPCSYTDVVSIDPAAYCAAPRPAAWLIFLWVSGCADEGAGVVQKGGIHRIEYGHKRIDCPALP